jgi:hypothetical protein
LVSVFAVLGALFALPLTADAAGLKLSAILIPNEQDPGAKGTAVWRLNQNGTMTFDVNIADVTLDDEAIVLVDWQMIGEIQLVNGQGSLTLSTADGDWVPRMKRGQTVTIFSPLCWNLLEGKLVRGN